MRQDATQGKGEETGDLRYFLMKSEPDVFSIDDLAGSPNQTNIWEGVRNFQVIAEYIIRSGRIILMKTARIFSSFSPLIKNTSCKNNTDGNTSTSTSTCTTRYEFFDQLGSTLEDVEGNSMTILRLSFFQ